MSGEKIDIFALKDVDEQSATNYYDKISQKFDIFRLRHFIFRSSLGETLSLHFI
jgi:hypothetical protein